MRLSLFPQRKNRYHMRTRLGLDLPEGTIIRREEKRYGELSPYERPSGRPFSKWALYEIRYSLYPLPGVEGLRYIDLSEPFIVIPTTSEERVVFATRAAMVPDYNEKLLDKMITDGTIPFKEEGAPVYIYGLE